MTKTTTKSKNIGHAEHNKPSSIIARALSLSLPLPRFFTFSVFVCLFVCFFSLSLPSSQIAPSPSTLFAAWSHFNTM